MQEKKFEMPNCEGSRPLYDGPNAKEKECSFKII